MILVLGYWVLGDTHSNLRPFDHESDAELLHHQDNWYWVLVLLEANIIGYWILGAWMVSF